MVNDDTLSAALRRVTEEQPHAAAAATGDQHLTYSQLLTGTQQLAGLLHAEGVRAGDRVVIFSETRPEYIMALFACSQIGAVLATVYPSFGADEINYILAHSEPVVALVESDRREVFDNVAEQHHHAFTTIDLVRACAATPEVAPLLEDLPASQADGVLVCYTSGTTSRPKAVLHSNDGLLRATEMHIATWGITSQDRLLVMAPMAWLFGLVTTSLSGLLAGATLVLTPHFNPVSARRIIVEAGVTVLMGVGAMYAKLTEVARGGEPATPNNLRLCLSGGEGRNEMALAAFRQSFGCAVHDIYAASECFPIVTYNPRIDPEPRPGAAGRVVTGAQVRIVDADGADVPQGQVGELIARSAASMLGYFRQDELTAEVVDPGGWFHSKDMARIEDGLVYIVGRGSDMIIRGGANVSPAEVERVLATHPAVAEVAVIGLPDEVYGQRVAAYVVRRTDELTEHELIAFSAASLAKYKVPTAVHFVHDMPRTATGKIRRSDLAAH